MFEHMQWQAATCIGNFFNICLEVLSFILGKKEKRANANFAHEFRVLWSGRKFSSLVQIIVNLTTVLISIPINGSNWSNILRHWIHIKNLTAISFHFCHLNIVSQDCDIYTCDRPLPLNKFWINSIISYWKLISKLIQKPKECSFNLLQSTSPYYHLVHIKLCHKLVEMKNLHFPPIYYSAKTWLTQIPNKNFKLILTWEKCDDGDISVWAFLKVHHHLCRPLPCVASHWGPVLQISTPVDHCNYLPVIFIASVYSFFELHLRHCRNKHTHGSKRIEIPLTKMAFQKTWFSGKNNATEVRGIGSQPPFSQLLVFWPWAND